MSNLNELKPIINLNPFARFCCTIGNLPSSYMASLTYEEQLMWFCDFLQNTVIPAVNNNAECVKELQELYVKLKNYVDNYFKNLDVQEEINNKLDSMVEDGQLTTLISNYLNPFIDSQNSIIENFTQDINQEVEEISRKTNALANGSPLVANSIGEMTDQTRVYLNTTNGHIYYYNGNTWTDIGLYQSAGIGENTITPKMTTFMKQYNITPEDGYKFNVTLHNNTGEEMAFPNGSYSTKFIEIPSNENKIVCFSKINGGARLYFYDNSQNFLSSIEGTINSIINIPENSKYIRFGFQINGLSYSSYNFLWYNNFISGLNIYNIASLKPDYINFDSSKILYNTKKLNLIPSNYDTTVAEANFDGNKAHFEFSYKNNDIDKFIGFPFNFLVKIGDKIGVEIIDRIGNFNISEFALYNSQASNFTFVGSNTNKTIYLENKKRLYKC